MRTKFGLEPFRTQGSQKCPPKPRSARNPFPAEKVVEITSTTHPNRESLQTDFEAKLLISTLETSTRQKCDPEFFSRDYSNRESHETQGGANNFVEPNRLCSGTKVTCGAYEAQARAVSDAGLPEALTKPEARSKPVFNRKGARNDRKRASQPRIPSNGFRGVRLEYDTRNPR